jgi:outer membrane lipoprotein carrier protein
MKLKAFITIFGALAVLTAQMWPLSTKDFVSAAAAAESKLTLEQILDRVENHYKDKSFTGMMRWEYEKPEVQVIITDGHKLWIHRPADNQVMTGSAPAFFSDGKGASFLSDIKLIRQKFKISLENSKDSFFYELKLKPLEKTLDVTDIRLSVTKNTFTVIRIITYNSYGDENRIELLNHQFDVKLDDSLFSLKIPPGADVLQMDE